MIGMLFDIVNAAWRDAMGRFVRNPDPTRTEKSFHARLAWYHALNDRRLHGWSL
jgi:hypothetical protein